MATEKRLIDAVRHERVLRGFAGHLLEAGKTEAAEAVNTLIKGLKLEPTVEAVEVVRCKDCIHRVIGTWSKCTGRKLDDFCSDGVNRFHD